jgi:outer membrane receptor protein involved in Fe transport
MLAWAQEVGVHYERDGLESHLALFRTDVTNERVQDPITLEIRSAGSSVRQGIEGTFAVELPRGAMLSGRGTYTDATLSGRYADAHDDHGDDTGDGETPEPTDGQRVPGIARYMAQLAVQAPIRETWTGRAEWRVTGPYVPIGEPDATTGAFSVFDLGITFPLRDGLLLDLEVRNVLDKVYPEMRSSGYVSPGTPRSFGMTLQYVGGR